MFQTDPALSPEMTELERQQTIRDAFNRDRSQMTLMLAHKLRIPEVEIIRALEGDTACELDFSRWEEILRAFEPRQCARHPFKWSRYHRSLWPIW